MRKSLKLHHLVYFLHFTTCLPYRSVFPYDCLPVWPDQQKLQEGRLCVTPPIHCGWEARQFHVNFWCHMLNAGLISTCESASEVLPIHLQWHSFAQSGFCSPSLLFLNDRYFKIYLLILFLAAWIIWLHASFFKLQCMDLSLQYFSCCLELQAEMLKLAVVRHMDWGVQLWIFVWSNSMTYGIFWIRDQMPACIVGSFTTGPPESARFSWIFCSTLKVIHRQMDPCRNLSSSHFLAGLKSCHIFFIKVKNEPHI